MVETTDRQTDRRERESGYTIDPDDISRCRQDQKMYQEYKKLSYTAEPAYRYGYIA